MNNNEFELGAVVICKDTGQAGTVYDKTEVTTVLLANNDLWMGSDKLLRVPQDQADLDAAPREYDRFKNRASKPSRSNSSAG